MFNNSLGRARDYIEDRLRNFGYEVSFQEYKVGGFKACNVISKKKGKEKGAEILVVGAHYDTFDNPGADDNASAVAGLLEIARLLKDSEPLKEIRFVAFANEEPPYFRTPEMGSYEYAKSLRAEKKQVKALILEMIGFYSDEPGSQHYPPFIGLAYPDIGNFIAFAGNMDSMKFIKAAKKSFKKHTDFPIEHLAAPNFVTGVDFSDHWAFYQFGYEAFIVTDTAFYRNTNYHKTTDTYENLDYERMAEVVRALGPTILDLAGQ